MGGGDGGGGDGGVNMQMQWWYEEHARMLPLRRASSNVALHAARSVRRGIFIMRCVELMSARALQETRAHSDTV